MRLRRKRWLQNNSIYLIVLRKKIFSVIFRLLFFIFLIINFLFFIFIYVLKQS